MSKKLGEKLREIRIRCDYTQLEVSDRMKALHCPIAKNSISRWETGYNSPGVEQFVTLCRIYGIQDVVGVFGDGHVPPVDHCLNRIGREKVEEYRQLLIDSGKYVPDNGVIPFSVRLVPFYELPASAGHGVFLDSEAYEMVEIGPEVPLNANFGVPVSGDSMEPNYHHGDAIWVQQQPMLEDGEIGLMMLNGQAYVKQLGNDTTGLRLISLNEAYAPISIGESDTFRVLGKVVATTPRP